jgi:hypothetical protein
MNEHSGTEATFVTWASVVRVHVRPSTSDPDRAHNVTLTVDGRILSTFEIPMWRPLSYGYASGVTYLWSARTVITVSTESGVDSRFLETDEDLLFVFKVEPGWLLVCESSVRLASEDGREVERIELGDVASVAAWESDTLVIEEARGRVVKMRLSDGQLIHVA